MTVADYMNLEGQVGCIVKMETIKGDGEILDVYKTEEIKRNGFTRGGSLWAKIKLPNDNVQHMYVTPTTELKEE